MGGVELSGSYPAVTLDDMERIAIADAMRRHNGNVSHVAETLGITRQALYRKLEKYGMK